ncbi:HNH endonuclease signature motif containing protein [Mycobacterium bourgelatii]|uniref:HNH endonuclease signature motif containing protein n=1 Tax=Mycobacterium bourgelatii TaxID=1273442 RepID=UPI0013D03440|nr:HNH endonuclease signature motif containing protein [Mycobacterium bourgelatii]
MSVVAASSGGVGLIPKERLEVLFAELAELSGQRNAIDGRMVEIFAQIEGEQLWGMTGARSLPAVVAWKTGVSPGNAHTMAAVARRVGEFPRCVQGLKEGRLSLDQVGVIAARAGEGSDEHYAELASVATVTQLRTAVRLEPRPDPSPAPESKSESGSGPVEPELRGSVSKSGDGQYSWWRIKLPAVQAATFDAALGSHLEGLMAQWKREREAVGGGGGGEFAVPMPTMVEAFLALVQAGWDSEVARRPQGQHTTVVMHVDVKDRVGSLHLGPVLSRSERQLLGCDASCEVWFERDGEPIGAGRTTRGISRRLRRALEYRHPGCAFPGCGASRGLHAHHIVHWEDGGATELANLVLLCPFHHRLHHRGVITITGPADQLCITDSDGRVLTGASLARPPTQPPPDVPPCPGPTGERADWWWYQPYEPESPTAN